jgi:hypothetical protein
VCKQKKKPKTLLATHTHPHTHPSTSTPVHRASAFLRLAAFALALYIRLPGQSRGWTFLLVILFMAHVYMKKHK